MKKISVVAIATLALSACCQQPKGLPVEQEAISRVELMANFPEPYKMLDWKQKALDFESYAFDFNSTLPAGPVIWIDNAQRNFPQPTFGLYTAMADDRQGPDRNNGEFHESLNTLHALISAGLMGIDKTTSPEGYNYVKMVQNYFNKDNGWNIVMNNTCPDVALLGGGYGRDWWYDVYPNLLYYAVCELFPGVEGADEIQRTVAEQFAKADEVLDGNYDYSYFDYSQMKGMVNWIPFQQDAAGGHGWVLLAAYEKYGDDRYLERAKSAIAALDSQKESRFYEILLPMGIYTAARLNAQYGCNYDLGKMFSWVFDGCTNPVNSRTGWGITAGKWGEYEISGLQGSLTDGGGFAFFMNSVDVAWPFVPIVKYQPQYARAIGKWMLNLANNSRLFFPDQLPDENQCLPGQQSYTNSIVGYEGLRFENILSTKNEKYSAVPQGVHPVALGDGPLWYPTNPKESMFSLYSTSACGILGAIVDPTDVEGILKLNCNATDFYSERPYNVNLMYNPFGSSKKVLYELSSDKTDLFDIVSKTYLARNVSGSCKISLGADSAAVIVELPAGAEIQETEGKLVVNNNIISYR
ncbi:MAG: hypothetical protein ACI4TU_05755 [Candidatus Cryptobacteroides sp.]